MKWSFLWPFQMKSGSLHQLATIICVFGAKNLLPANIKFLVLPLAFFLSLSSISCSKPATSQPKPWKKRSRGVGWTPSGQKKKRKCGRKSLESQLFQTLSLSSNSWVWTGLAKIKLFSAEEEVWAEFTFHFGGSVEIGGGRIRRSERWNEVELASQPVSLRAQDMCSRMWKQRSSLAGLNGRRQEDGVADGQGGLKTSPSFVPGSWLCMSVSFFPFAFRDKNVCWCARERKRNFIRWTYAWLKWKEKERSREQDVINQVHNCFHEFLAPRSLFSLSFS